MSKFLDSILKPEIPTLKESLPKAEFEIKRLSALAGTPVTIELRALPYGKIQDLATMGSEQAVMTLLAGCPELSNPALAQKYGGATPAETVKNMFLPGEIVDLFHEVERLSGFRKDTIKEIKNS